MKHQSGITLIEVMIAIAIASSISAIGFTGIVAFGRAITRAKQFTSETMLITTAMRASVASADDGSSQITSTYISAFSGQPMTAMTATKVPMPAISDRIPTPKNWTVCTLVNATAIPNVPAVSNYPAIPGVSTIANTSILVFYLDIDRKISGFTNTTTEDDAKYLNISNASTTGNVGKALGMSQISCRNTLNIRCLPCIP